MIEKAYFGMGCFWKAQEVFDKIPGVISTRVGYMGGCKAGTYENAEREGHVEVVEVTFSSKRDSPNPKDKILGKKSSYEKLLRVFFKEHDATTLDKQGSDVGKRYRSVIFYDNDLQERRARQALSDERRRVGHLKGFGAKGLLNKKIVTKVLTSGKFYEAELEHQKYLEKKK
jgi:peptide-methionine (S)-S-oxide reductase